MNKRNVSKMLAVMILSIFLYGCQNGKVNKPQTTIKDNNSISKDNNNTKQDKDTNNEEEKKQNDKKQDDKQDDNKKDDNKQDDNKQDDNKKTEYPWEDDNNSPKIADTSVDNKKTSWWFIRNKTHTTPGINSSIKYKLSDYGAHYVGDVNRKVLYLTFDEGYENGYTGKILDTLKANNVKATFFVTLPYLNSDAPLVKRMVNEGHVVGNHTKKHLSMPDLTSNKEAFDKELTSVADKFKDITGKEISPYFRPPMGHYSQKSLAMTKNLGYKSIFWSFAYNDWEPTKQPEVTYAKNMIFDGLHNGAILLLHAVSNTNTEILDDVIKQAKSQGYEFELLP